ncbi:MAG: manganese efflux pump [Clostridia bacterium]|nr:manganese efflux pump [Clostridia bacterium]
MLNFAFFATSISLGIALAMDAFSVSLANGLNCPCMSRKKMCLVAGIFALFQAAMPLLGWFAVHTAAEYFEAFRPFIPWIAMGLLGFIGGKMLVEGLKNQEEACNIEAITLPLLLVQGVATSIDALSVGFKISDYTAPLALLCAVLIAVVTFIICLAGVIIGRKFGTKLAGKASVLGGVILIAIGLEIFISGIL